MAMTNAGLGTAIKTELEAVVGDLQNPDELEKFATAIAKAVVEYIQGNAVVGPGSFSNSGGPVTGSGTVS